MTRFLSLLIFLLVGVAVVGGWHGYLWLRLVRDPAWPPGWQRGLSWALILLGLSMPAAMLLSRFAPPPLAKISSWVAFSWMGIAFLLFVFVGLGDLLTLLLCLLPMPGAAPERMLADPARRLFFARTLAAGSVTLGLGLSGLALREALGKVQIKRVEVPLRDLPSSLDGLKVVQLSDIHVGSMIGKPFIEEIVAQSNALEPDLLVITGDLVDGSVARLKEAVAPLAGLRARYGVYFVTGNHEYYSGAEEWIAHLPSLGIQVLENRHVSIGPATGAGLDLAGISDPTGARMGPAAPSLEKALQNRDPSRALLLLAHQPRAVDEAVKHKVGLMLSGHTHGGQIWPFGMLVALNQPYVAGLHRREDTMVYVNRGTAYWGPPMRLGAPPEITFLSLRSEDFAST